MNSVSPVLKLLFRSVRLDSPDTAVKEAERIIKQENIDWDQLYRYSDAHSVKPQVNLLLSKINTGLVPVAVRERFEYDYKINLYRQLRFVAEYLMIFRLLDKEGIQVIPFKGFWLAHEIYGNIGDRESTDIDLYINFKDFERIIELLLSVGYKPEKNMVNYPVDKLERKSCEYTLNKFEDGKIVSIIDLHWKMGPPDFLMDITLSDLRTQITTSVFQDHHLLVFSPEANLLLTVMHHGGKDPLTRLRDISDISRIVEKESITDWSWIIQEAKRFHVEKLLFISIVAASAITGTKIPDQIKSATVSKKISNLAMSRTLAIEKAPLSKRGNRVIINDWFFRFRSRDGFRVKISLGSYFLRKVLAPVLIPNSLHPMFTKRKISDVIT